ncbi:polysaccharide deacetylase family protein [Halalkalicoccus salilacus]|uniref:polysaccharide deacetylase family protein n=1 Tax=Halalkalicoccus salilacus TaxID=3117459 RepID=UPI00300ED2BF
MNDSTNRRRFLTAVGAGTFALAGCSGQIPGSDGDGNGNGNESGSSNTSGNGNESGNGGQNAPFPALDEGELVDDFENLEDWTPIEDGQVAGDTENALVGSQSARIQGSGTFAGMFRAYPEGLNVANRNLSLALAVDAPRPARVTVELLAPGESDMLRGTKTVVGTYTGWMRMDVGITGQRGEPNLENVQEMRIRLDAAEETDIRFWVDDLRATPKAEQGYVMLTFDDGVASQYENVFPRLNDRDMPGVVAVSSDSLNRDGRLYIDQLREMRDAGWDVSSHPEGEAFQQPLDDMEAIRSAVESNYEYLDNRGFPNGARHMFVPYHNVNQEVIEIIREYHELNSYFGGMPAAIPFTDPMHVSRVDMHDNGFTDLIDMAAEHNQLAVGLAHGVVDETEVGNDPLADMSTQQLEALLDYIEQSDVQVVTASQLVDNQGSL